MKKRLLCMGLLLIITQVCGSGCHLVARWRANHPYGTYHHHPLLHPIQTRRAIFNEGYQGGPGYGPGPGCCDSGFPVGLSGHHGDVIPTGVPTIGYPMPIAPGPKVVPYHELPHPMPVPKKDGN